MEETTLTETQPKTEKKPIIDFEFLSKVVPALLAIALLIGLLKIYFYYRAFNLPIVDYIEISEVLTYFIHDLYISGWFLFMILFYFFRSTDPNSEDNFEKRMQFLSKHIFPHRFLYYTRHSVIIQVFLLELGMAAFGIYARNHISKLISPMSLVLFIPYALIMLAVCNEIKIQLIKYDIPFNKSSFWFTWKLFLGLYLLFYNSFALIQHTKHGAYKDVNITFEDKELKGSTTQYYIGKTNNFVFWYNTADSSTTVYKMDDIKQIRYKGI